MLHLTTCSTSKEIVSWMKDYANMAVALCEKVKRELLMTALFGSTSLNPNRSGLGVLAPHLCPIGGYHPPCIARGEDLPLAADGIDGSLHRAAVMIFQGASRLTRMCVLPAGSRWLYHCGEVKKIRPARLGSSNPPRFVTCLSWEKRK